MFDSFNHVLMFLEFHVLDQIIFKNKRDLTHFVNKNDCEGNNIKYERTCTAK